MTLDELSVVFSADTAPFEAAVSRVTQLLGESGAAADGTAAHFAAAGSQAGAGFASGLLASRSQVISAARSLAEAAANALRGALDIHSPSRLTKEMGLRFDEGLADGMEDGRKEISLAAGGLGGSALFSLENALGKVSSLPSLDGAAAQADRDAQALSAVSALSLREIPLPAAASPLSASPADSAPISITLPLEIDGYRLGVAAIEGINRVAQGTGRIELNL